MNILHLKYVLEVAACGSINRAAEKLYIDQPNLSRSVKELESSLGVVLFERSSKGMRLTPDGERFIAYAKKILDQVDAVESMFKNGEEHKNRFSISVPRASYISEAFSAFSAILTDEPAIEIYYKETNALRAIKNILEENYNLGIIRYAEQYDKYYKDMLEEKGLKYELITDFRYILVMNKNSSLAKLDSVHFSDLTSKIEIAHADPYVPYLPLSEVKKEELPDVEKRIYVFERASQFELLSDNPETFMWVSPVPEKLLTRYGLTQRVCDENKKLYKDVMISRKDYKLTRLDNAFITELCRVKRENWSNRI